MGVLDSLNKANANWAANGTVNINLGDGNTKVDIDAGNAEMLFGFGYHDIDAIVTGDVDVATKCGDNTIDLVAGGNATAKTGLCGEDVVNISAGKNAVAITGDSDDTVNVRANGFVFVDTATKDKCSEQTDNDTVSVVAGSNIDYLCEYQRLMCEKFGIAVDTEYKPNYINLGYGNDEADIIANYVEVDKGAGTLLLGALGSNYKINSKADKNTIGAYGDNYQFNIRGAADNDVRTMDYWIRDGKDGKKMVTEDGDIALKDWVADVDNVDGYTLNQYDSRYNSKAVSWFQDKFATYFDNKTKDEDVVGDLKNSVTEELSGMTVEEIAEAYGLSCEDAQALQNIDRSAKFNDTTPLYALVETAKTGCDCTCDSAKYTLVELTSVADDKVTAKTVNGGQTMELTLQDVACGCESPCCGCEKELASHERDNNICGQEQTTDTYELFKNWTTGGVANWGINLKKSSEIELKNYRYDFDCSCKCPCEEEQEAQEEAAEVLGNGKLMAYISSRGGYIHILGEDVNYDITEVNPNIRVTGGHIDTIRSTTQEQTTKDWAMAIFNKKQQECGGCGGCNSCGGC